MSEFWKAVVGGGFSGLLERKLLGRDLAEQAAVTTYPFPSFMQFSDRERVTFSCTSVFEKKALIPQKVGQ